MIGLAIGIVCGAIELFLLKCLMNAVQKGNALTTVLFLLLKLLVLACAFVPVVIFLRHDLLWCGIGISVSLVTGSLVYNLRSFRDQGSKKGGK